MTTKDRRGDTKEEESSKALGSSVVVHIMELREKVAEVRKDTTHAAERLDEHHDILKSIKDSIAAVEGSVRSVWTAATVAKWAIGIFLALATLAATVFNTVARYLPDVIRAIRGG